MRTAACVVLALAACTSPSEPGAAAASDAECDALARGLCERLSTSCEQTTLLLERAALPASECQEALETLPALDRLPPDLQATAHAALLRELLRRSPVIEPGVVDAVFEQARQHATTGVDRGTPVGSGDEALPESPGSHFHMDEGVRARITARSVTLEGPTPLALDVDMMPADGVDPWIGLLRPVAAANVDVDARMYPPPELRLIMHAEATVSWGTVRRLIQAARVAGFEDFAVLTRRKGELRDLVVSPAPALAGAATALRVAVDEHGLRVDDRPIADLTALAHEAETRKKAQPGAVAVRLRAADSLALTEVVAVLDALRGPHCNLDEAMIGEAVPDDCWFWQPVLEPSE